MKLVSLYQLNENLSLEEAVKIFHDECKPFQKEIGFNNRFDFDLLYRGMKNKPNFFIGNIRPDRRPTDTPVSIHEFIDNWFYKKFGVRFRSNAMFATKNSFSAATYGASYIVFPIGEFKYCYSNDIEDVYVDMLDMISSDDFLNFTEEEKDDYFDELTKKIENSNYTNQNLKTTENANSEIMINCKTYLAIKPELYAEFVKIYKETYK